MRSDHQETSEDHPLLLGAVAHAAALRRAPQHGMRFVVLAVHGSEATAPSDAPVLRTVFIIPQFHQSPVSPLTWSSLGEAIADVQLGVAELILHLVHHHGLRCVGTEGSWRQRIERTPDQDQIVRWALELEERKRLVLTRLEREDPRIAADVEQAQRLLTPYLVRSAIMADGVGLAMAWLRQQPADPAGPAQRPPGRALVRFGIEDEKLNTRGVELAGRLHKLDLALAQVAPPAGEEGSSAVGQMWLNEYPAFAEQTGRPLATALRDLDRARIQLRSEEATEESRILGHYTAQAKHVSDQLIQLEQVEARHAYEQEVAARQGQAATPGAVHWPEADQKRYARLLAQRDRLQARYDELTGTRREARAVERTLAELRTAPGGICAIVMGSHHTESLVELFKTRGEGHLGIVVVQPYTDDAE